ncbi:hypothetical protein [Mesorhizobium sp. ANAO-SY3R2]|uniref:hypothetical protein n=1 Tax=Mesorhizobium sp. ANAO-SY3R2 TaxID=3166644 RepID=UPI003670C9CE
MTDHPTPFMADMVRALLEGRKTQTRRIIKDAPNNLQGCFRRPDGRWIWTTDHRPNNGPGVGVGIGEPFRVRHSIGDRLYVREAWRTHTHLDRFKPSVLPTDTPVFYEADIGGDRRAATGKFRQGMHMPRWASRLTLTVTDVRVQRIQEIAEADAMAEGIERVHYTGNLPEYLGMHGWRAYDRLPDGGEHPHNAAPYALPTTSFRSLWDSLNAERGYGWDANPWVTATSFTIQRGNIDEVTR